MPDDLHPEPFWLHQIERFHLGPDGTLERVELGSRPEPFGRVFPLKDSLHRRRVCLSPEVTEPCEDSPRLFQPNHFDDISTELPQGVKIKNDQAVKDICVIALTSYAMQGDE